MTSTLFPKCTQPTRRRGFSLLELLVVLLIVAALMVLAGPSFTTSLQNSRLQSAVGALGTDMAFRPVRSDHPSGTGHFVRIY